MEEEIERFRDFFAAYILWFEKVNLCKGIRVRAASKGIRVRWGE